MRTERKTFSVCYQIRLSQIITPALGTSLLTLCIRANESEICVVRLTRGSLRDLPCLPYTPLNLGHNHTLIHTLINLLPQALMSAPIH